MDSSKESIIKSLSGLGINDVKELIYNPSYDELYKYEIIFKRNKLVSFFLQWSTMEFYKRL